jgi:aerobic-type carbon monoxide dehydrogenase small subunit (CoxS/CutS family)
MITEKNTIMLTLIYNDKKYQVQTRQDQYHTLMTLIADHLALPDFGLCCGMGSCGTCMVEMVEMNSSVTQSALSCDVQVNDTLANTTIIIPAGN